MKAFFLPQSYLGYFVLGYFLFCCFPCEAFIQIGIWSLYLHFKIFGALNISSAVAVGNKNK